MPAKKGALAYLTPRMSSAAADAKSADTFFSRLNLELNQTSEAVGRSISACCLVSAALKDIFLAFCTDTGRAVKQRLNQRITPLYFLCKHFTSNFSLA
jgi:hypothetical protein